MKRNKLYQAVMALFSTVLSIGPAEGSIRGDGGDRPAIPVRSWNLKPYRIAAAITLTEQDHAGRLGYFDVAAGAVVTLPRATGSGSVYRFFVKTTITSNSAKVQVGNADDVIQGNLGVNVDNAANAVVGFETASTSDTVTLNGTDTGGIRGDYFEIEDVVEGLFSIRGIISAVGTEVTQFTAAV